MLLTPIISNDPTKADKVSGATAGDLAALNSSGDLADSGKTVSSFDAAGAASAAQGASLQKSANLSDLSNAATARTNLGLGSAATQPTSAFDAAGAASTVNSALTTHEADQAAHGATSANTANKIVSRDGSGNFSAGTVNFNSVTAAVNIVCSGTFGDASINCGIIRANQFAPLQIQTGGYGVNSVDAVSAPTLTATGQVSCNPLLVWAGDGHIQTYAFPGSLVVQNLYAYASPMLQVDGTNGVLIGSLIASAAGTWSVDASGIATFSRANIGSATIDGDGNGFFNNVNVGGRITGQTGTTYDTNADAVSAGLAVGTVYSDTSGNLHVVI